MKRRQVSISKLGGEEIIAVSRGEIVEVTFQGRLDAILIRTPQDEEDVKRLAELLREVVKEKK